MSHVMKLGQYVIYPKADHQPNTDVPAKTSSRWYVMPGRRVIHIEKLEALARKLHLPLERIKAPSFMPLD